MLSVFYQFDVQASAIEIKMVEKEFITCGILTILKLCVFIRINYYLFLRACAKIEIEICIQILTLVPTDKSKLYVVDKKGWGHILYPTSSEVKNFHSLEHFPNLLRFYFPEIVSLA